jgi:hypothetical protein
VIDLSDNLAMSSWPEFLSRLLESSHKVEKAAVFNVKGQPLATTENLQVAYM